MNIRQRNDRDFEPIVYPANINEESLPNDNAAIDELVGLITRELTRIKFSRFIQTINTQEINTIETPLDNLVEILGNTVSDLWDNSFQLDQIFLPFNLRREIRQRMNQTGLSMQISVINFNPTTVRELGQNQIIPSQKGNYEKIYPETLEEQIRVNVRRRIGGFDIECSINQLLNIRNKYIKFRSLLNSKIIIF